MDRDVLIRDAIDVSRASGVPMLFLSNPGFGKTTGVKKYAAANNMAYIELNGSQCAKEDVAGMYGINNTTGKLSFFIAEWYDLLVKAAKKQDVLLFIDELSGCTPEVQEALLKVIFDRKLKEGYDFPKNVTIISAGNYEENLPDGFGLIGPQLNRFAVINCDSKKTAFASIIDDMGSDENDTDWTSALGPNFKYPDYNSKTYKSYVEKAKKQLQIIAANFANKNEDYALAFDSTTSKRYGVMTVRTLNYWKMAMYAGAMLGIDDLVLKRIGDGLIGAGDSFDDETATTWRKALHRMDIYTKEAIDAVSEVSGTSLYNTLKEAFGTNNTTKLDPEKYTSMKIVDLFGKETKDSITEEIYFLQQLVQTGISGWQNLLIKASAWSNTKFGTNFMPQNASKKDLTCELNTVDGKYYITTCAGGHTKIVIYSEVDDYAVGQTIFNE